MKALPDRLRRLLDSKLNRDIAWNLGSLAILALSGIAANLIIVTQQGAEALGVFNQVYAIYLVLSQTFVLGVHYSVLRHAAEHAQDRDQVEQLVSSALSLGIVLGAAAALVTFSTTATLARVLDSEGVKEGLFWAGCALVLFPVNKVLLAAANGMRAMRLFAVAQGARYLGITLFIAYVALRGLPPALDAAAFLVAELLALLVAGAGLFAGLGLRLVAPTAAWLRLHLRFGVRGMLSGLLLELNSRVDVMMIGYFMSDRAVGIYSFAAMLLEGCMHLIAVFRNNYNPLLVKFVGTGDLEGLRRFVRRSAPVVYALTLAAAAAVCGAFWMFTELVAPGRGLQEGWGILLVLLAGLWLCSGILPFDNLMLQAGFPGYQTLQQLTIVVANAALNLALIPALGIVGAALASATSYAVGACALIVLARRHVKFDLLSAWGRR